MLENNRHLRYAIKKNEQLITIDCRSQRGRTLSFDMAEKRGNEMAFALAVAGINRADVQSVVVFFFFSGLYAL